MGDDLEPALRSTSAGAFLRHCRFARYHIFLLDTAAYRSGRIRVMRNSKAWMISLCALRMAVAATGRCATPELAAVTLILHKDVHD
jgi:hypothetical protein